MENRMKGKEGAQALRQRDLQPIEPNLESPGRRQIFSAPKGNLDGSFVKMEISGKSTGAPRAISGLYDARDLSELMGLLTGIRPPVAGRS